MIDPLDAAEDEAEWTLARRAFLADERDRLADEREATADEREAEADDRETEADLRDIDRSRGTRHRHDTTSSEPHAAADAAAAARAAAREARRLSGEARDAAREARADEQRHRSLETPTILARLFSDIARQLFEPDSLDDVLLRIAAVATDLVPGCETASITVMAATGPATSIATHPAAAAADERQYEAGEGPCLDAMAERLVVTPDIGGDLRWPRLKASGLEMRSAASFGLHEPGVSVHERRGTQASLNLYARAIDAFSEGARELGLLLAAHASTAIAAAEERTLAQRREADLHAALLSRDVIGQAKGILMERDKITADEAFTVLRRTSQAYNRKLRDIAERLAFTGEIPAVAQEPGRSPHPDRRPN